MKLEIYKEKVRKFMERNISAIGDAGEDSYINAMKLTEDPEMDPEIQESKDKGMSPEFLGGFLCGIATVLTEL